MSPKAKKKIPSQGAMFQRTVEQVLYPSVDDEEEPEQEEDAEEEDDEAE